jgi:Ser/Thr protein kinase RdoA (MazF antagonist)
MTKKSKPAGSFLVQREHAKSILQANLKKFYPGAIRIVRLKIHDASKFTFKKAVRYELTVENKQHHRFVSVIRANQPSKDTFIESRVNHEAQSYLYRHGFDTPSYLVSKSFGYFPAHRIAMYEELPGVTLASLIAKRSPSVGRVTALAGGWLAAMHNLEAKVVRLRTRAQEKRETRYFLDDYKWYYPAVLPEAKKAFAWWWHRRDVLMRGAKSVLLHGDFNPNNILAQRDPNAVGVIDFGNAWRYDPMYDVANFLQQMDFLVWQKHAPQKYIDELKTAFLSTYRRSRKLTALDRKKLPLFQAWWSLQIMAYVVSVRHGPSDTVTGVIPLVNLLLKATET